LTIKARDEFTEDIDLVVNEKWGNMVGRGEHGMVRRYLVKWNNEDIYTLPEDVIIHDWQNWPLKLEMNRFIEGRPNPIRLPIIPMNFD
jgi:hypothetical protein